MSGKSDNAITPMTRALSEYIAAAATRELPPAVLEKTGHHILDSLAAIVSGSRLRAGELAINYVKRLGGAAEATLIGTPLVVPVESAALANAMGGHADETDDSHLRGRWHPGCGVVPAALAVAELADRSGADFLRAVALGYDIGTRFNMSLGYPNPNAATHSTHTLGVNFGAAAAAAALLRFDPVKVRYVLSYAVQQASGCPYWYRDSDHVEKAFDFGGMGARNGVAGAMMVASGMTGVEEPFTGQGNFFDGFALKPNPGHADRGARQALRDHGGLDQEVVRRLADPVGARRDAGADRRARRASPTTPSASSSPCRTTACTSSTTARCRTSACSIWSRCRSSTAPSPSRACTTTTAWAIPPCRRCARTSSWSAARS